MRGYAYKCDYCGDVVFPKRDPRQIREYVPMPLSWIEVDGPKGVVKQFCCKPHALAGM